MARSKLRWPRLVLLALAAVGLHSLNVQGTPTLDSVVETWKARQDRTRSARFTWHGTLTTAGAMELGKRPAKDRKAIAHLPDKTVKHDCSLSLDGDMLRYERNGPEWVAEFSDYAAYPYIAVFDGEVGKSFYGAGTATKGAFPGKGFVEKEAKHPDSSNSSLMPLLLTYRALRPNLGHFLPERSSLGAGNGMINGRPCLLVEERAWKSEIINKGTTTYWVDPHAISWCYGWLNPPSLATGESFLSWTSPMSATPWKAGIPPPGPACRCFPAGGSQCSSPQKSQTMKSTRRSPALTSNLTSRLGRLLLTGDLAIPTTLLSPTARNVRFRTGKCWRVYHLNGCSPPIRTKGCRARDA